MVVAGLSSWKKNFIIIETESVNCSEEIVYMQEHLCFPP